ncbi:MAG: hypothetical protein J6T98_05765 [Salinivirgaceae bacterium]|nr:hypothetical protein [Salinivirgaceae bacterium]
MEKRIANSVTLTLIIPVLHFLAALLWPSMVKIEMAHLLITYGMLSLLTGIHLFVVKIVAGRNKEQAPIIIVGLNMLKMLLSIVLLFVLIVPLTGKSAAVGINFTVAYLFFLVFDSQIVILLLKD